MNSQSVAGLLGAIVASIVMVVAIAYGPIGQFGIDLARPRDVAEVRTAPRFIDLHRAIWDVMRDEVLRGYQQQLRKTA